MDIIHKEEMNTAVEILNYIKLKFMWLDLAHNNGDMYKYICLIEEMNDTVEILITSKVTFSCALIWSNKTEIFIWISSLIEEMNTEVEILLTSKKFILKCIY